MREVDDENDVRHSRSCATGTVVRDIKILYPINDICLTRCRLLPFEYIYAHVYTICLTALSPFLIRTSRNFTANGLANICATCYFYDSLFVQLKEGVRIKRLFVHVIYHFFNLLFVLV